MHRGYSMAARRNDISLWVFNNISPLSPAHEWNIFQHQQRNWRTWRVNLLYSLKFLLIRTCQFSIRQLMFFRDSERLKTIFNVTNNSRDDEEYVTWKWTFMQLWLLYEYPILLSTNYATTGQHGTPLTWKENIKDLVLFSQAVVKTAYVVIWRHLHRTARDCSRVRAARATRLFFFIQDITFLINIFVADAKTP